MSSEGFRVETPQQAAWAMRKYRALAQKKAQHEAMADAERERIAAWELRVVSSVEAQMEFFASHLEGYAMKQRAKGTKSIDFPDGTIKTRQSGASFDVDKGRFIEWAEESKRDDLLRVTFSPDMTAIKGSVVVDNGQVIDAASGEIVPGLAPIPERVSVKIEPDLTAVDLDDMEEEGYEDVIDE